MDKIDKQLLAEIADWHKIPQGSLNIRKNGQVLKRKSTKDIQIVPKKDKSGIDIIVADNVVGKSVHIPVLLTVSGINDLVYNDFYIGKNADVLIVAGCGIHNAGNEKSQHNGIHSFHLAENCKVRYIEKHLGLGNGSGQKVLNPITKITMQNGSFFEMETVQLGGVTSSVRQTEATLFDNAQLVIHEKIMTDQKQTANTKFKVNLLGKNSSVQVQSRSVAKDCSKQSFVSNIIGQNECFGHVECDGIILDKAQISSTPKIEAKNVNASLVHEAAIGKITGEQLQKLQTLGLTEQEAQNEIIKGFLK